MLKIRVVLVALLTVLATLLVSGGSPAQAAVAAPVATPGTAIAGELVTFTGAVPPRAARAVRLEEKRGARWVAVASGRSAATGRYSLVAAVPRRTGAVTAYRVVAPRARVAGKVRPKVVTAARSVRAVQQTGALAYTTDRTSVPVTASFTATFTPARAGRVVVFEARQLDGTWTEVRRTAQDAAGRSTHTATYALPGTYEVRARTLAARGADAKDAPSVTVTANALPPVPQG